MFTVFFITTFALGFNNKRNCMRQRMLKGLVILFAGAAVLSACTKDEMKGDAYISFIFLLHCLPTTVPTP